MRMSNLVTHVTFRDPPRKRIKGLLGACIDSAQGLRGLGQKAELVME